MREVRPAAAVGIFLGVFGLLVLVAIGFTPDFRGRVANGVCGGVLIAIGAALVLNRDRFK